MTRTEPDIFAAAQALASFAGKDLTSRIVSLESGFAGATSSSVERILGDSQISHELLSAAYVMKRVAGQINVVIHAIGILLCLPHVLEPGERVLSLSLGAGNTGRAFDLETDIRIAEFKFIHWQGGAETIRQNALFKDLYEMIEYSTDKRRAMYVIGTQFPLKFLNSGRALDSVMSRNRKLWQDFQAKYGDSLSTVSDYYALKKDSFSLVDVSSFVPGLVREVIDLDEDSDANAS